MKTKQKTANEDSAESPKVWQRTSFANLIRYTPSFSASPTDSTSQMSVRVGFMAQHQYKGSGARPVPNSSDLLTLLSGRSPGLSAPENLNGMSQL